MEPLPANTSTKFLSMMSNCRVLKSDSRSMLFELLVVDILGMSIFLPLRLPANMGTSKHFCCLYFLFMRKCSNNRVKTILITLFLLILE